MSKVRFGILSTARIGVEKVIPAMQSGQHTEVVAIASRDGQRTSAAAERLGIPKTHASYEALLADPDVDAIYNPLPNHLHVNWSIAALEAGKHVLCEKPIGLTADEGQQLVNAAARHPRLKVMEAFMYRHHPQWQRARQLVREGAIGELRTIQSFFSYHNVDPHNIRNRADIGGGGLADIGCYTISLRGSSSTPSRAACSAWSSTTRRSAPIASPRPSWISPPARPRSRAARNSSPISA